MNPTNLRLSFALLAAVAVSTPAHAGDLVKQVADGNAWTTVSPTGGSISITFRPDGTGQVGSGFFFKEVNLGGSGRPPVPSRLAGRRLRLRGSDRSREWVHRVEGGRDGAAPVALTISGPLDHTMQDDINKGVNLDLCLTNPVFSST